MTIEVFQLLFFSILVYLVPTPFYCFPIFSHHWQLIVYGVQTHRQCFKLLYLIYSPNSLESSHLDHCQLRLPCCCYLFPNRRAQILSTVLAFTTFNSVFCEQNMFIPILFFISIKFELWCQCTHIPIGQPHSMGYLLYLCLPFMVWFS